MFSLVELLSKCKQRPVTVADLELAGCLVQLYTCTLNIQSRFSLYNSTACLFQNLLTGVELLFLFNTIVYQTFFYLYHVNHRSVSVRK